MILMMSGHFGLNLEVWLTGCHADVVKEVYDTYKLQLIFVHLLRVQDSET
jgi:hypothetical protein